MAVMEGSVPRAGRAGASLQRGRRGSWGLQGEEDPEEQSETRVRAPTQRSEGRLGGEITGRRGGVVRRQAVVGQKEMQKEW